MTSNDHWPWRQWTSTVRRRAPRSSASLSANKSTDHCLAARPSRTSSLCPRLWVCQCFSVWLCGSVLVCGSVGVLLCGSVLVGVLVCGSVSVLLCGSVLDGVLVCGSVGVLLCGSVGLSSSVGLSVSRSKRSRVCSVSLVSRWVVYVIQQHGSTYISHLPLTRCRSSTNTLRRYLVIYSFKFTSMVCFCLAR